jgi:hypothetical protein
MLRNVFLFLLCAGNYLRVSAQDFLPAAPVWKGNSEKLLQQPNAPDAIPFEQSGGNESAGFEACVSWFRAAAEKCRFIHCDTLCITASGNYVPLYYFSTEWPMNTNKPLLLFQGGIHSGEIDGLDAGMLLFRDLALGNLKSLEQKVNLAFIPVLNRDGLLRSSSTNRINQRGPLTQGWRSNSLNQNLNRDYSKLDAPETRAIAELINRLNPTLYLDIHVTDGADYQYDITYGFIGEHGYSPEISRWLNSILRPFVDLKLKNEGHIPGDLVFLKNEERPEDGNMQYMFGPRFSHAYADVRHTPGILVENHSLKPFRQRVLGTRVFLEAVMELLANKGQSLQKAMQTDMNSTTESCTLSWQDPEISDTVEFLAFRHQKIQNEVAGAAIITWNAEPYTCRIPLWTANKPKIQRKKPRWFIVPVNRTEIIERLLAHGIRCTEIQSDTLVTASFFKFEEIAVSGKLPIQGRMRMQGASQIVQLQRKFLKGSVIIDMQQPLSDLCMLLLDPDSPDSFFQWGMFADISERTEYFEMYAMAQLAEQMMRDNKEMKEAFDARCMADEKFRNDPEARLHWWYERSAYADENYLVYPIAFEP